MADKLNLEVAVPERLMIREDVEEVQVRGTDGYLGILPGHAPLMTGLGAGVLRFGKEGETRCMAVHGGVMEVLPDRVRILADRAEWADEVDLQRAEEARRRANDLLRNHEMQIDVERAQAAIARAHARLEAYDRMKS